MQISPGEFKVGDRVEKREGYLYPGVVVAVFKTAAGKARYVVECTAPQCAGMLHIFSWDNLKPEDQDGTSPTG